MSVNMGLKSNSFAIPSLALEFVLLTLEIENQAEQELILYQLFHWSLDLNKKLLSLPLDLEEFELVFSNN